MHYVFEKDYIKIPKCFAQDVFTSNELFLYLAEVVEHACSITSLQLGESLPSVAKDMDTYTYRVPLGVTAGITP